MLKRPTLDRILDKTAGALRKGSDLLKTLAHLLAPESHPEPEEVASEVTGEEFEVFDPNTGRFTTAVIPPEAEEMIAKPSPRSSPRTPPPPLAGSLADRGRKSL